MAGWQNRKLAAPEECIYIHHTYMSEEEKKGRSLINFQDRHTTTIQVNVDYRS